MAVTGLQPMTNYQLAMAENRYLVIMPGPTD
jgi:hypothetical protein